MKSLFFRSLASASILSLSVLGAHNTALANGNVSDITGGNVSDITGGNVSDITGGNVSDITGTNTSDAISPLDSQTAAQLAQDMSEAYRVCTGGGDCSTFYALLDYANSFLGQ